MRFLGDDHLKQPAMQKELVQYANTYQGRKDLCIQNNVPKNRSVISVGGNRVSWLTDQKYPGINGAKREINETKELVSLTTSFRCRHVFPHRIHEANIKGTLPFDINTDFQRPFRKRKRLYIPGISVKEAVAASSRTFNIFSNPHPETTSTDGMCGITGGDLAWHDIVIGAGTNAWANLAWNFHIYIKTSATTNQWDSNRRAAYLFDTSSLTSSARIISATLSIMSHNPGQGDTHTSPLTMDSNVFTCSLASNTDIIAADYNVANWGTDELSTTIAYGDWETTDLRNEFLLNDLGLTTISKTAVTKLGIRDTKYDVADQLDPNNHDPIWSAYPQHTWFSVYFTDWTGSDNDPFITIVTLNPADFGVGLGI
ncbi:MAG: hypothetical protein CMB80_05630 [Flammeovirgaceae bacterium]|nr:hypothetical protein [Flammeovirgaceae bacterium]|tara:strand:- start:1013 stop:2122 length:1110 start_codon:yes stop_codon:yes gene_type:complete